MKIVLLSCVLAIILSFTVASDAKAWALYLRVYDRPDVIVIEENWDRDVYIRIPSRSYDPYGLADCYRRYYMPCYRTKTYRNLMPYRDYGSGYTFGFKVWERYNAPMRYRHGYYYR